MTDRLTQMIDKRRVVELVRQRLGDTVPMGGTYAEGYSACAELLLTLLRKDDLPTFRAEAARREAEGKKMRVCWNCGAENRPEIDACYKCGAWESRKPDAPPPPAPFVTDHKWLDPECHASGCQTLILKAELEKLRERLDKYMWQVRDTCARAETAEAELRIHRERAASLNNMWRHEFSREVEAAADKLFARMAWPHKEIHALAGGNDG